MFKYILALLLFALPCAAQEDSSHIIDSLRTCLYLSENRTIDFARILSAKNEPSATRKAVSASFLAPYISAGLNGTPPTDASEFCGIGVEFIYGHLGIEGAVHYEHLTSTGPEAPHSLLTFRPGGVFQVTLGASIKIFIY